MTPNLQTTIGLTAGQFISEAQRTAAAAAAIAASFEDLTKTVQELNATGVFKGGTFTSQINEYQKLTTSVKEFTAAQQKAFDEGKRIKGQLGNLPFTASQTVKTTTPKPTDNSVNDFAAVEKVRNLFPVPPTATIAQLSRYESSLARIQTLIRSGKVTSQRFDEIFGSLKTGGSLNKLGTLTGDESKLVSALGQISKGFKTATDEAEGFGLGSRNAFRITEALILKEIISGIVQQLQKAVVQAAEFQIKISEIRTLSTENQSSFSLWSKAISDVSNALGINQIEVAKAAYEALSSQITEGKDQTVEFIKVAGDLARVGVSTIGEAGKLLASVFNTYNINVERAEEVSAKLFRAIDRGNFTAQDLASNFGRVANSAAALGVKFEETLAALTVLTRQGVTAADAETQLSNVFLKLQNPTAATTKFLRSMGFETGQAAIQALGFIGVLKKIEEATKGDVAQLADFGGELRAIRGLIGLTTRGKGGEFETDLAEIQNDSLAKFRQAKAIRGESAGDQLTIELNKIKNFFTNDLGQKVLNDVASLTKHVGSLSEAVAGVTTVILEGAKIYGVYFIATRGASAATTILNVVLRQFITTAGLEGTAATLKLTAGLNVLKTAFLAVGAAAVTAFALDELAKYLQSIDQANKKTEDFENTVKRLRSAREGATAPGETAGHKLLSENVLADSTRIGETIDKLFQPRLQKIATEAQGANKVLERLKEEGKETAQSLSEAFKKTSDVIGNTTKTYAENIRKADKSIDDSKKHMLSMKETVDSLLFDLKNEFADPFQKFILRDQEIERLKKEIEDLFATGDPEKIEKARGLSQKVLSLIKEDAKDRIQAQVDADRAERLRQNATSGRQDLSPILARTEPQGNRLLEFRREMDDLEEKSQSRQKAIEQNTDRQLKQEESRKRLLDEAVKNFEKIKVLNDEGKVTPEFSDPLGKLDINKLNKVVDERAKAVTDLLKDETERQIVLVELEKARQNLLNQGTAELRVQAITTKQLQLGNIRNQAKDDIEKAAKQKIAASLGVENANKELGISTQLVSDFLNRTRRDSQFSTIGQDNDRFTRFGAQLLQGVIDAQNVVQRQLGKEEFKFPSETNKILEENQVQIKRIIDLQDIFERQRTQVNRRDAAGNLLATPQDAENLRKTSNQLALELNNFISKFTGQNDNSNFEVPGNVKLGELRTNISQAIDVFNKSLALDAEANKQQANVLDNLGKIFSPAEIATLNQTNATRDLTLTTQRATTQTENLIREFQGLNKLPPPAPPANVPIMPQGNAFGGQFHHGGLLTGPKGYDNLMIRAEAGEFVMNQESTRKWLPQLIEMNNGKSPKFAGKYHEGGLVQTNVGDVNVTITGPVSPEQNVRAIGRALKREIRRGNLNLR